jgi:DNA-binding transcriptional ArsR family regulator
MTSITPSATATDAQLRALAHPLRVRILRLCLTRERTNQELAECLDVAPGTVLRHVRELLAAGFLVAEEVRTGQRGALERPYRATGATWYLRRDEGKQPALSKKVQEALVAAHLAELHESPVDAERAHMRGTMRLDPAALTELRDRIEGLLLEYGERDDAGGVPVSFLWSLHGVPDPPPPVEGGVHS